MFMRVSAATGRKTEVRRDRNNHRCRDTWIILPAQKWVEFHPQFFSTEKLKYVIMRGCPLYAQLAQHQPILRLTTKSVNSED